MSVKMPLHGFPDNIKSVHDIIDIVRDLGQAALLRQPSVNAVFKGEVPETADTWVIRKSDGSPVSSTDVWVNTELVKRLKALGHDDARTGFLTEEGDKTENIAALSKENTWIIDPIDGTRAYIKGENTWNVIVAFHRPDGASGGIVYYPALGVMYYTADDGKSYRVDEQKGIITILEATPKTAPEVIYKTSIKPSQFASAGVKVVNAYGIDRYWSILMKGGADIAEHVGYFASWDVAAAVAIASRCGVVYCNRDGTKLDVLARGKTPPDFLMPYQGFVAGHADTFKNIGFLDDGQKQKPLGFLAFISSKLLPYFH